MEFGQKRRFLPRKSAEPLPADHSRPGLPLRSLQRRGAAGQSAFAALVDAPAAGAAQTLARARRGQMRISPAGQPQDFELRAAPRTGNHPRRRQPLAFRAAGGTGFVGLQANDSHRAVRAHEISGHHRRALFADARPAQFFLVFARTPAAAGGGRAGRAGDVAVAGGS